MPYPANDARSDSEQLQAQRECEKQLFWALISFKISLQHSSAHFTSEFIFSVRVSYYYHHHYLCATTIKQQAHLKFWIFASRDSTKWNNFDAFWLVPEESFHFRLRKYESHGATFFSHLSIFVLCFLYVVSCVIIQTPNSHSHLPKFESIEWHALRDLLLSQKI